MKAKNPTPPRLPQKILFWFLRDDLIEEVTGDLDEKFYSTVKSKSLLRAKLNYWFQVLNYVRPFAIRKSTPYSNIAIMFHHNFTLTFRNFVKYKGQFLINLTGLSTGLACVLFIYLWVADEMGTDHFHKKNDRLYQVMSNHTDASGISTWKGVPGLLLEEIQTSIPEVEQVVASTDAHEYTLSVEEKYFKANGKFASEDFLEVFSFPLHEGDKKNVLSDKSGILISRSLATRLFKSTDVIGKQIDWHFWGKTKSVQVTGVMEDVPQHSSEQFDFVMSWDYFHDDLITYKNWYNYYGRIMLVLRPDTDKESVSKKIDRILKEKQDGESVDLFLAKYSDRYLYSKYENGVQAGGRIEYVRLFIAVAVFILFIACINFINLSTARASLRMKEIGVKKSLGASRKSLISQYITESVSLSIMSMVVAVLLVWSLLPQFNFISHKNISISVNSELIVTAILFMLTVGIIAGSYPALYLSGLKAIEVLKGKLSRKTGEVWGRKTLVVVQFTLSVILIVGVLVVYEQMEFVKTRNLGFDRDNVIYFEREGKLIESSATFVNELKALPGVTTASVSGFMAGGTNSTGGVSWEGKTPEDQVQFWEINAGYGLVEMLGIKLLEGRTFSDKFGADSTGVIFNETAIAAMGLKDPIGKKISHYTGDKTIIGIVEDFHLTSLHVAVEPAVFLYAPASTHFVMAKLEKGREAQSIKKIQKLYESFNPGYPFIPQFLDQDYQSLYRSEQHVAVLSRYFAGFAILISCLGLLGLSTFTAERRIKEIGIRKVMGSGVTSIVYLLTIDFTKMVLIAILIALPVSYYIASTWLANFAYKIELAWWHFFLAGGIALLIAWITVATQTLKAATVNPVECLRNE